MPSVIYNPASLGFVFEVMLVCFEEYGVVIHSLSLVNLLMFFLFLTATEIAFFCPTCSATIRIAGALPHQNSNYCIAVASH